VNLMLVLGLKPALLDKLAPKSPEPVRGSGWRGLLTGEALLARLVSYLAVLCGCAA